MSVGEGEMMCLKCITLIRCLVEATCWCVCFCQSPAASGYGTQSVRLGKDAIKDFDCCCLSLQPCRDPVVTWVHTLWYDEVPENAKNFFQPVTSQPLTLSHSHKLTVEWLTLKWITLTSQLAHQHPVRKLLLFFLFCSVHGYPISRHTTFFHSFISRRLTGTCHW